MRQRRSSPNPESTVTAPAQVPAAASQEPAKTRKPRVAKAAVKAESPPAPPAPVIQKPVPPPPAPVLQAPVFKKPAPKTRARKTELVASQPELLLESPKPKPAPIAPPAAPKVEVVVIQTPAPPPALITPKVIRGKKAAVAAQPVKSEPIAKAPEPAPNQRDAGPSVKSEPTPQPVRVVAEPISRTETPAPQPVRVVAEPISRPEPAPQPAAPVARPEPAPQPARVVEPPISRQEPAPQAIAPVQPVTRTEPAPVSPIAAPVEPRPVQSAPPTSDAGNAHSAPPPPASTAPAPAGVSPVGVPPAGVPPMQDRRHEGSELRGEGAQPPQTQNHGSPHPHQHQHPHQNHGNHNGRHQGQGQPGQPGQQQQAYNDRGGRNFNNKRDRWGRNNDRRGGGKYFNNRNGQGNNQGNNQGFNDGQDQHPDGGPSGRGPNPLPAQAAPLVPPEPAIPLPPGPHLDITEVQARPPKVLKEFAKEYNIENPTSYKRHDLICEIMKRNGAKNGSASSGGVLELERDGFGFLRSPRFNYAPCPEDPYVSVAQIRRHNLRRGEFIQGPVRIPRDKERYFALAKLDQIEGKVAEDGRVRPAFDALTAMFPNRRIFLEGAKGDISMRAMDLICPLGFGQRGLIVAPPRTGKTILLQKIANAVMENNPQAHLMMILIDERPEEVTDMLRTVKGEVLASTFDEQADRHIQVAELAFERAKRLVENKVDVVILMDSITRLTRAYNAMEGNTGKIGTGGIVPNALQRAKRLFGIARNIQEGGSLTIIGTALVDTGSIMDNIIFEEFKGTGNMEISLDRNLSDQRIFPAFNIQRSGTRKEELLYHPDELARIHALRKVLAEESPIEAMSLLLEKINKTQNNVEFLMSLKPT